MTYRIQLLASTMAVIAGAPQIAAAQDAPSPPPAVPAAVPAAGIEEIVVTATRREQNLQSVPVAVTAISSQALINAGIGSTEQIAKVTPSLVVVQNGAQTQFNLRGVNSRASYAGDENGVAVYLDGIYQPIPYTGLFDLLEVDRVEVLRGPQGTLFGRNSIGGLVNVVTPDPSFEPKAHLRATYGRFDMVQVQGYASTALSDTIAIDVAGNYYDDNGYVRDLVSGNKAGDRRSYLARSKLLFRPSDTAKFVLTFYYNHTNDQSAVLTSPVGGRTVARNVPGVIVPTKPYTVALGTPPPFSQTRQFSSSLKSVFELGAVNLEVMGSYTSSRQSSLNDFDFTAADIQGIATKQKDRIGQAEIRLVSATDGPFEWTAGIFGLLTNNRYDPYEVLINGRSLFSHQATSKTKSFAPFAEGTYAFSDALKLTVGARFSYEKRDFDYRRSTSAGVTTGEAKNTWKKLTPRATLQYIVSPDLNVYASYSRGFKSGLFDTPSTNLRPINEEQLDAYEVGLKSDPSRFVRFNLAAFYYKHKDLQVNATDPAEASARLINAGKSTNYGIEGELSIAPFSGMNLRAGAGYLHTEFDSFPRAVVTVPQPNGGNATVTRDLAGERLLRSPKFTATMGGDYATDVSFGRAGVSANAYYSSRYFFEPAYRLSQKPFVSINASLWIEPAKDLRLSLWVENLANEIIARTSFPTGTGDYVNYQKPRTVGVTLDTRL